VARSFIGMETRSIMRLKTSKKAYTELLKAIIRLLTEGANMCTHKHRFVLLFATF
jgi:hypothetical protein